MIGDVRLIETGDGGDVTLKGNDIQSIEGLQNMPYIAIFGGNPNQLTQGERTDIEAFDYWGNFLFEPNNTAAWFNSRLEKVLKNTTITPQGVRLIETAINKDLNFMREFAEVTVSVSSPFVDRLKIDIILIQPEIGTNNIFTYIWNATNGELSEEQSNNIISQGQGIALGNILGFEL